MQGQEKRRHTRHQRHLVTEIVHGISNFPADGVTDNISESGALVKTSDWPIFQPQDPARVTFYIPPVISGTEATIGVRGHAIVTRIDPERQGIALQFRQPLKKFAKLPQPLVPGMLRYKKLARYVAAPDTEMANFLQQHRYGFFLEKSSLPLDEQVMFQFDTETLDEFILAKESEASHVPQLLNCRVIPVAKAKGQGKGNVFTIGRAPINDIVIYNRLVSKSHAYLLAHPQGVPCYLVDSGSKNGTLLNGKPLRPQVKYRLVDGDEIWLGSEIRLVYLSTAGFSSLLSNLRRSRWP